MRELTYPFDPGTIIAKKKALRRADRKSVV